jgi:biopolymer transport protein ExbD
MRFKRRLFYEQGLKQADIAPLVNIVFLLLLFILLIVGFAGLPGVRVSLPGLALNESFLAKTLEIVVNKDGAIFYQGKGVTSEKLKILLDQFPLSRTAVLIKADKEAALTSVMRVWKICQELGLRQVNIATTKD